MRNLEELEMRNTLPDANSGYFDSSSRCFLRSSSSYSWSGSKRIGAITAGVCVEANKEEGLIEAADCYYCKSSGESLSSPVREEDFSAKEVEAIMLLFIEEDKF